MDRGYPTAAEAVRIAVTHPEIKLLLSHILSVLIHPTGGDSEEETGKNEKKTFQFVFQRVTREFITSPSKFLSFR